MYLYAEHSKIVSAYSKNTVAARHLGTHEIKRIPSELFNSYKDILYEGVAKGNKDSKETRIKKRIASKRPRTVKQKTRVRSVAATKWVYNTPKGFCETANDLFKLYPTFTKNTLIVLNQNAIISNKFASIHTEFKQHVGKTFSEIGLIKERK